MRRLRDFLYNLLHSSSVVRFDDRSSIEFFNPEALLYTEADGRRVEIPWYFERGKLKTRVLDLRDIATWDTPHEVDRISTDKKAEIVQKIREYCRKKNIPLETVAN